MLSLEQFAECSLCRCYCCARSCVGDSEFIVSCSCVCLYLMHSAIEFEVHLYRTIDCLTLVEVNTKIVGTDSILALTDICGLTLYVGNQSIRECQIDIVLRLGQFAKLGNGHVIVSDNNLTVVHLKVLYLPSTISSCGAHIFKSEANFLASILLQVYLSCYKLPVVVGKVCWDCDLLPASSINTCPQRSFFLHVTKELTCVFEFHNRSCCICHVYNWRDKPSLSIPLASCCSLYIIIIRANRPSHGTLSCKVM